MSKIYKIGETLEVSVEKIVSNGLGLCFVENLTVFVPLSAKGDKLRVEIRQIKGRTAFAKITEILEPSSDRVEPKCGYFGTCGGCDFQQLSYESQLESKVEIIRDCLKRIGKVDFDEDIQIIPSPKEFGYRLRTQFHADKEAKQIGFFGRQSHDVIDIKACPILVPSLEAKLTDLRENLNWKDLSQNIVNIETATAEKKTSVYSDELMEPTNEIFYQLKDDKYFFNAKSFFQGNQYLIKQLVEEAIGDAKGETALDLYCGVGLFSLSLARKFDKVFGVEANKRAIKFARKNAEHAKVGNVDFRRERVRNFLIANQTDNIDFILIDPPRSGVKKGTLENITALRAKRISYVSCNPSTLARDLRILVDHGYSIQKIIALDLFPQTHHVETIVHLNSEN